MQTHTGPNSLLADHARSCAAIAEALRVRNELLAQHGEDSEAYWAAHAEYVSVQDGLSMIEHRMLAAGLPLPGKALG